MQETESDVNSSKMGLEPVQLKDKSKQPPWGAKWKHQSLASQEKGIYTDKQERYGGANHRYGPSLVAQVVKNLSAMRETRVWSLGWEDNLEKRMLPIPVFLLGEFMDRRWNFFFFTKYYLQLYAKTLKICINTNFS